MRPERGKIYVLIIYAFLILTVLVAVITKILLLNTLPVGEGVNFCIYTVAFFFIVKKVKFLNIVLGLYLVLIGIYSLNHFFSIEYSPANVVPLSLIVIYFSSGFILLLSKAIRDYIYDNKA